MYRRARRTAYGAKKTIERFPGSKLGHSDSTQAIRHSGLSKSAFLTALVFSLSVPEVALSAESITYEYDALGRLEKVVRNDGSNTITIEYDYDAAGNRTARIVNGGAPPPPPPNNPPTAVTDTVTAATPTSHTYANLTANDSDPDGDSLTITAVTQPTNGIVTIHSSSTVRIVPTQAGTTRQFTYTISDGNGGTDTGNVLYTVPSGGGGGFLFSLSGPSVDGEDQQQELLGEGGSDKEQGE